MMREGGPLAQDLRNVDEDPADTAVTGNDLY